MRTAFDVSPLARTLIGFDNLTRLLERAAALPGDAYPPHDIKKCGDDRLEVELAVAGYREQDLSVTVDGDTLIVTGRTLKAEADPEADAAVVYLHRGIARRAFEKRFTLADHVRVEAANLENGLLTIRLIREVPEAAKPRQIAIQTA
jgi:molecular chaperone IbpA